MKKFQVKLLTALMIIGMAVTPFGSVLAAENGNVEIQLLFVNDLHGKVDNEAYFADFDGDGEKDAVGGMEYLAGYLKKHENENANTLLVHSGDMIGGSPLVSSHFQDEPTIEMMEAMGFDVGVLGNHEFDEGVEEMLRIINGGEHPKGTPGYDGMNFPMVAANVQYKDTKELIIDPYVVKEIAGQKIGFIGVVTTETPSMVISTGNENAEFTDEAEAINKYVPELQAQGVKAIVVLAHNPGNQDSETGEISGNIADIANKVNDEVDIIVAAHNHIGLNGLVDDKLIVQAYSYSTAFGDIDLEIDPTTGDIVKKSAEIVTVVRKNIEADEEVAAILKKYEDKVEEVKNQVIGQAAFDLDGGYAAKGEIGDNALGNLIADGMVIAMDSDFALMNGGGIRDDLTAGDITFGDIFDVQPFGNVLNKVELTGADLELVLNAQFSSYGPDVSVAGFTYTWSNNEVVEMLLPDGTPVNPEATYTVVVNNYMYGSDYRLQELGENMEVGPEDLQATIDYIQSFDGPIEYYAESRISEVKEEKVDITANDYKYVVKSGDTLGKIAAQYGFNWKELADYNNIEDVRKLMPGQEIFLPIPEGTSDYDVYLVKSGDTIGKIAAEYSIHWKDLATYNELENAHWIYIGQEIMIPKN